MKTVSTHESNVSMQQKRGRWWKKYVLQSWFILIVISGAVIIFGSRNSKNGTKNVPQAWKNAIDDFRKNAFVTEMRPTREESLTRSNMTLREFVSHEDGFHLAMAPAFFGFYAYFGALMALDEDADILTVNTTDNSRKLQSVAGASAGAMAAILLSAGIKPRVAAEFATTLGVSNFADPPGILGVLKGNKFESIMKQHLEESQLNASALTSACARNDGICNRPRLKLEDSVVPVAVSGFDLLRMKGIIMSKGCMAKAARASATFPGLFQPVPWWEYSNEHVNHDSSSGDSSSTALLIDGGITDQLGLNGLAVLPGNNKRVLNLLVGSFGDSAPPGPSKMPRGLQAHSVASVSILNTPGCGPWAMSNGPKAVEAARLSLQSLLDAPMLQGDEEGHYELHIDASTFVPSQV